MILTKIVSIITAKPTSPPGIIETKKANALSSGLYKTVFQILESILSSYPRSSKNTRKFFILLDLCDFSAKGGSVKYEKILNKFHVEFRTFLLPLLYIQNKKGRIHIYWREKENFD